VKLDSESFEDFGGKFLGINLDRLVLLFVQVDKGCTLVTPQNPWPSAAIDETIESVAEGFGSQAVDIFQMNGSGCEAHKDEAPLLLRLRDLEWAKMVHPGLIPGWHVEVEATPMQLGCGRLER
jgi:hypothetical protein